MRRKDIIITATIDAVAGHILQEIARVESEDNKSAALRKIIREAAERRGLAVTQGQQEVRVEHHV